MHYVNALRVPNVCLHLDSACEILDNVVCVIDHEFMIAIMISWALTIASFGCT